MGTGFVQVIALMAIAVVSVAIFRRVHLPPILAYLFAGVIVGPSVTGLFAHPEDMHLLAEIGIVFLLFSLGLEFSLPKLLAMRHMVFGVGMSQMLMTTLVFCGVSLAFGLPTDASVIIGGMLALSSTAIVIKQVSEMGIVNNRRTQLAISVLLFQDLAVVPFLIAIPLLGQENDSGLAIVLALALVKGIVVVIGLLSVGKWLLPLLFREVARTRTDELFVLSTILVALLAAGVTYAFGLSMALGAFLAGMMLGESQYKYQLEADIRPFRDILMGLFFVTVGMQLDLSVLVSQLGFILPAVFIVMLVKVVLVSTAAYLFKVDRTDAWAAGFKLCQIGEFSFVIAALATTHGVISNETSSVLISIGILSMAVTPWLIEKSLPWSKALVGKHRDSGIKELEIPTNQLENHVIIAGFGRVGQSVARMLKIEKVNFVTIDSDPIRVQESHNAGEPIIFGDASQKEVLDSAHVDKAKLVLITFDQAEKSAQVINMVKKLKPDNDNSSIIVRTKRDYSMEQLYQAGATQVVPEIQEGSLMLVSQVLHYVGIPMSRILKRVRAERKGRYDHMHGFYPGETTEITYGTEDKLEFMHAVMLTANASCIGKQVSELNLSRMRVNLKGVRRENREISRGLEDLILERGDVVIIAGKPRRVERAERFLLEGD